MTNAVYGWNTQKTSAGYVWTVYSFVYGQGHTVLRTGVCATRAQAVGNAKRHVLPLRRVA